MKLRLTKAQQFGLGVWFYSMGGSFAIGFILSFVYELLCDAQGLAGLGVMFAIPFVCLLIGAVVGIIPFLAFTFIKVAFGRFVK